MSFVCVHCLSLYAVRFYARNILSLCVCCWCAACYRYYFPPTKRQIWVRVQATNEWLAAIISHHHRAKPKAIDKDRGRERNTRITNRIEYTFTFSRIHLFARSFVHLLFPFICIGTLQINIITSGYKNNNNNRQDSSFHILRARLLSPSFS